MSLASPRHVPGETAVITDPAGLAALKPSWRALWAKCPAATPFQSPDWLMPWWDLFGPGALRVIVVHENGELVGVAPLYRDGTRLKPIGVSLSDYQDILVAPRSQASAAIAAAVAAMRDIEGIAFDEVYPDASVLSLAIPGFEERLQSASPCPIVALPEKIAALGVLMTPSALRHLRTARRRAARRGECVIIEGDSDNALALVAELSRLSALRQAAKHQHDVFDDPRVEAFLAAAVPGLVEQGLARLHGLTIADEMAAVYLGFLHRGRAYAYLSGFDPAFAFESPGAIVLAHAIETAVKEGARAFDFLRGDEAYKYDWGARDRWNLRLLATRRHG